MHRFCKALTSMLQRCPVPVQSGAAARRLASGAPSNRAPALPRPSSAARPLPRAAAAYGAPQQGGSTPALDVVQFTKEDANSVSIIGNVGRVELKQFSEGAVAKVSLAVSLPKRGEEAETDWYDVEAWDELAAQVNEHVKKGARVLVTGRMTQQRYTNRDGQKVTKQVIRAARFAEVERYRDDAQPAPSHGAAALGHAKAVQDVVQERPRAAVAAAAPPTPTPVSAPVAAAPAATPSPNDKEQMYLDLLYYPEGWEDLRPQNPEGKMPDFRKKGVRGSALWLERANERSKFPSFVRDYFGYRGQVPPPQWAPPQPDEDDEGDATQGSNVAPF